MSRSNLTENSSHPATRWLEWAGQAGALNYYDKTRKETDNVGDKFTFILLDQLGTIKGWNDASESAIYSNEVKDTRQNPFIVKAFKGGLLAQGIYANIKDRIAAVGGKFTTNLYIAVKSADGTMSIQSLQFKGAALREWMDFTKANKGEIYTKAVAIDGYKEGKKGSVTFRVPVFKLRDISAETNEQATALDMQLQTWLKSYFSRPTSERTDTQEEPPMEEPPIDHGGDIDPSDLPY
jgi:hypothetical protein